MRKFTYILILLAGIFGTSSMIYAQTFQSRVIENNMGYLVYQMRETSGTNTPTTTTDINDITFVIKYPSGALDMDLICSSNDYNIFDGDAPEKTFGGYDYHYWNASASPAVNPPHNWTVNVWEDIAVFAASNISGSGSSLFEVAIDGFDGRSLNWNQTVSGTATDFLPTIPGSGITYAYPTLVYDYVWVGGVGSFESNWFMGGNWASECGAVQTVAPTGTSNVLIPDVSGASGFFPNANLAGTMTCNNLQIASGATLTVPATNGSLAVATDLFSYGTLTIIPNADVTVMGSTHIENVGGLVVEAGDTGVGSFINDLNGPGTPITYGTSGSAKVQTYVENGSIDNSFYMHLMGPTLDDVNYTGPLAGADLEEFNVSPGSTYAYTYDETIDTTGGVSPWVNQSLLTYPVNLTTGIGLSTDDDASWTMELEGTLLGSSYSSRILTTGTNSYEMLCNPWPSAFEFDAFYSNASNNAVILGKYWIWDPVGGSWNAYVTGVSTTIQVGQAFIVQTHGTGGTVLFDNINRTHSNVPFRNIKTNWLTLDINGGDYSYHDQTVIRFMDGGTGGYDDQIEAIKWSSMYANATQIRSIAEDGTGLSINTMPQLDLQSEMVSVPVNFECGYSGEYTFTASDLESFEYGTEIWIEDKQDGNLWHHLSTGHETYTFTAGADDPTDRFIVHFFGPTAIEENEVKNVLVYGDHEYALIRNMTNNEIVKEVYIYSLAGTMILHKQVPEQNMYRFFVSNYDNYYVVKVVTDKNIYTEKVFIH